jgi:hypothetical protein
MMNKKYLFHLLTITMLAMLSLGVTSCGGDDEDDEPINVSSYILGTWHTFKATGYAQGESITLQISKAGEYSGAYIEMTFKSDGIVVGSHWEQDANGVSRWVSEEASYTVNGNIVNITSDGETASLFFDSSDKTLCIRGAQYINGVDVTINIFMKK